MAKEAQFTAGPWQFQPFAHSDDELAQIKSLGMTPVRLLTNDGDATIMAGSGDDRRPVARAICQTRFKRGTGYQTDCPERDANARLIAAAPDLLEALREAEQGLALSYQVCDYPATGNSLQDAALRTVRAAILKATSN